MKKEDFRVYGLEKIQPAYALFPGKMYAGRIPFKNGEERSGKTMFWLFEPDEQEVPDSIVIWVRVIASYCIEHYRNNTDT